MRIVSWNVNGIRSVCRKGFCAWLERDGADVVALQEVRAREEDLPAELLSLPRWQRHLSPAERPGYSGVGLLSRHPFDAVETRLGRREMDAEGRLQRARIGELEIVNCYFPNGSGKERDNGRIPFKLAFYRRLFSTLERGKAKGARILVVGDFNTAHAEIDLARPKENKKASGFTGEERAELDRWLHAGWVDTFRHFEPRAGHYTWWSQRQGVRARNVGWRIDYVLASPAAMPFVRAAAIHPEVLGSDHCPISVTLNPEIHGRWNAPAASLLQSKPDQRRLARPG